jgi:hypothetical protein
MADIAVSAAGLYTPSQNEFKEKLARSRTYQWLLEHSQLVQVVRETYVSFRTGDRSGREREPAGETPSAPEEVAPATPSPDERAVRIGKALFLRMRDWCRSHDAPLWVCATWLPGRVAKHLRRGE